MAPDISITVQAGIKSGQDNEVFVRTFLSCVPIPQHKNKFRCHADRTKNLLKGMSILRFALASAFRTQKNWTSWNAATSVTPNAKKKHKTSCGEERTTVTEKISREGAQDSEEADRRSPIKEIAKTSWAHEGQCQLPRNGHSTGS